VPVSKGEIEFALQALGAENVRVDGRALAAYRRLGLRFGAAFGEVEVSLGPTRALAVCSGEIITPTPERPNEGRIGFHVEFGPIASPGFDVGRASSQATAVANFIERLLRGSRAVDAEALCIVGGQKVWSVRVDVRVLDDDGNLCDACSIAALCALLHFRKADVVVTGETVTAYEAEDRVPVPLSVHHLPVPITFALFGHGRKDTDPLWILDPNHLEEVAMAGTLCVAVNQYGELCALNKPGGMPVDFALVEHCTVIAVERAKEIIHRIQSELEADLARRRLARRNIHELYEKGQLLTVEWSARRVQNMSPARDPGVADPELEAPTDAAEPSMPPARDAAGMLWAQNSRSEACLSATAPPTTAPVDLSASGPVPDDPGLGCEDTGGLAGAHRQRLRKRRRATGASE